jgi:DNA polymerase-3 subunit alpha
MMWGEDYVKFKAYLEKGNNLLVTGNFRQRYNGDEYEFRVLSVNLLETAKLNLTKHLQITVEPASLTNEFVNFLSNNVRNNPGKSALKFCIKEPQENLEVILSSADKGFSMNEELAEFLLDNPDVEVSVGLVN